MVGLEVVGNNSLLFGIVVTIPYLYYVKEINIKQTTIMCKKNKKGWIEIRECAHHGQTEFDCRIVKAPTKSGKTHKRQCILCINNRKRLNNERRKQRLVDYKGGKCQGIGCGYNKNLTAMEFHHMDPILKDSDWITLSKLKWTDKLKNELDKCVLLCANCHREEHYNLTRGLPSVYHTTNVSKAESYLEL